MLGDIAALGGVLGSALLSHSGASAQNAANAKQAQLNREFQERMSSTAYQRAVADMRAAGLNPALAYQQGGASAPSGSTARMENTLSGAASSASRAAVVAQEVENARATNQSIRAQTSKTAAEAQQIRIESAARLRELEARAGLSETSAYRMRELLEPEKANIGMRTRLALGERETIDRLLGGREALLEAQARAARASASLDELGIPHARNEAAAERTWWKRTISPYLNDAGKIARLMPKILLVP